MGCHGNTLLHRALLLFHWKNFIAADHSTKTAKFFTSNNLQYATQHTKLCIATYQLNWNCSKPIDKVQVANVFIDINYM